MEYCALKFPDAGEIRVKGYGGKMIYYTVEAQLCDSEMWALLVDQFRIRDDSKNGGWRGEYWGKLMRGASLTYRATNSDRLYRIMLASVRDLLTTQDSLGRITSYTVEREFFAWDMWSRKYVMLGLMYFLDVCKSRVLAKKIVTALKRHADYIIDHIGEGKTSIFETSGHTDGLNSCSILEAFVKLYSLTDEQRYLDFAEYIIGTGFLEKADLVELCRTRALYPYQFPQTKAYEMMSCFEGLLEYYKIKGYSDHLRAVVNFVDMVVESDYTIVGGSGCRHEYFDNSSVTQTEPAVLEIMQETCVTVTFIKLCAKLLALTGDAKYAEYIEKSGLNALYGTVNNENQTMRRTPARTWIEGGEMIVVNEHRPFAFDSYSPLFKERRGYRVGGFQLLQDKGACGCCVAIGSAGTAIMGLFEVMKGKDGIFVNLYSECSFRTKAYGEEIAIDVHADPYRCNSAKIKVNGKGQSFAVALRIPDWVEGHTVLVNGDAVSGETENGYLVIRRAWHNDSIVIRFKAHVMMRVLNGKVAFTKGPIALARDSRFDDISAPVSINARDGRHIGARRVKNTAFSSNIAYQIKTGDGKITLCDYAQAGKNYDDEHSSITVWQEIL